LTQVLRCKNLFRHAFCYNPGYPRAIVKEKT
jgi:hypothetical protein